MRSNLHLNSFILNERKRKFLSYNFAVPWKQPHWIREPKSCLPFNPYIMALQVYNHHTYINFMTQFIIFYVTRYTFFHKRPFHHVVVYVINAIQESNEWDEWWWYCPWPWWYKGVDRMLLFSQPPPPATPPPLSTHPTSRHMCVHVLYRSDSVKLTTKPDRWRAISFNIDGLREAFSALSQSSKGHSSTNMRTWVKTFSLGVNMLTFAWEN